ncbi:MAG: TIGR00296 family protein [Promethearchaeia archaeon]|nr:MAG: TIGR00296 family protein [Candidatus Lokiarchaeia archaeon]
MEITLSDGKALIAFARKNIETYLKTNKPLPVPAEIKEKYKENAGAFVTLNRYPKTGNPLRGCIGYILPVYPLWETISKVSLSAAFDDPRFPSVKASEMDNIVVEVSILTVPEEIKVDIPEDYLKHIKIGRDGLIITRAWNRGLLLPQVPVEFDRNWDVTTFLEHTCMKAGLPPNAWKDVGKTKVERFTAIIFEEEYPRGPIVPKKIGE